MNALARQVVGVSGVLLGVTVQARGGVDDKELERVKSQWKPDVIITKFCEGFSRHYQLNDDQRRATCELLRTEIQEFFDDHGEALWPVLVEVNPFIASDLHKQLDPPTARRVAREGRPLFDAASKRIRTYNDGFRALLHDDQKRIHDRDLKALDRYLDHIDKRLKEWRQGIVARRRPPPLKCGRPFRNRKAWYNAGLRPSAWPFYVNQLIKLYRFDTLQAQTACRLVTSKQTEAQRYADEFKPDIRAARDRLADALSALPLDLDEVGRADAAVRALEQPLQLYFDELIKKLSTIPTPEQYDWVGCDGPLKPVESDHES